MTKPTLLSGWRFEPPLIAHRGASAYAPENTLAAFKKAHALGARWLEFDVMTAACGEVVVFHDESLERTTNGSGLLHERPYSYLKTLDAGSWFSPLFAGEKIPTLKETLTFLERQPLSANVEIKAQPGAEAETVTRVLALLERHWPSSLSPPLVSSFSLEVLRAVRRQAPACRIGFLMDEFFSGWEESYEEVGACSLNVNQALLEQATAVRQLKEKGRLILAYTVNQPERAVNLLSWGVTALFTDKPDLPL